MLFVIAAFGFAQTDGDYRSVASGTWGAPGTWQIRSGGTWATATVEPTATNNVYIQAAHLITSDAVSASCKDLNIGSVYSSATVSTTPGGVTVGSGSSITAVLNVSGKVRSYTITTNSPVVSSADGTFYTDQTNSTVLTAGSGSTGTTIKTGTLGILKFVGATRSITASGEWNSNNINPNTLFSLDNGAIGSLFAGMKLGNVTFESGTISCASASGMLCVGNMLIKSGAKLSSARGGTTSTTISSSGSVATPSLTIDAGGVLELSSTDPNINCTSFTNNGTVVYSGIGTQNLAKALILSANQLLTYNNLIVSTGTSLTLNTTFPASSSTTPNFTIAGTLTLTSGKLIIPSTATLELTNSNNAISGGSSSSYLQTSFVGAVTGILKVTGLNSSKIFPIGSATNYLPITLSPVSTSNFSINVFNGATQDATPNGTAISDKTIIVDANYNINRTLGTGNCDVTLGWDANLEGGSFNSAADNQIGAAQYISGSYSSFTGTGNNNSNSVILTGISTFAPFLVGKNTVLPVTLTSFTAQKQVSGVQLKWNTATEQNNSHFHVQRSTDGITFSNIAKISGAGNSNALLDYFFIDKSSVSGMNYYRLNQVDFDGTESLSKIVSINMGFSNSTMQVYALANSSNVNISISIEQVSVGRLIVYNVNGQKVFEQKISLIKGNNDLSISMQNAENGVFIATYSSDSQFLKKKFIR